MLFVFKESFPDSYVHGANMGLTWVLSAPCWPHEFCYQDYLHSTILKYQQVPYWSARWYQTFYPQFSHQQIEWIDYYYKHNTNPWYELKTKRYPIFSHVGPQVWSIYVENKLHIMCNKFIFVWQIALVSRSKGNIMLRVTGLCAGNSPMTDEFPAQRASNAQNDSIWWRHHAFTYFRNILWLSSGQNFADIILKRNVLNECFCAWFKFQQVWCPVGNKLTWVHFIGYGLVPPMEQAITWQNDDPNFRSISASSGAPLTFFLNLTPWISNYIDYIVWTGFYYSNFNGVTIEVLEWINNFIPHNIMDIIHYPCWD